MRLCSAQQLALLGMCATPGSAARHAAARTLVCCYSIVHARAIASIALPRAKSAAARTRSPCTRQVDRGPARRRRGKRLIFASADGRLAGDARHATAAEGILSAAGEDAQAVNSSWETASSLPIEPGA